MTPAATFDDVWRMFQEMVREDRERRAAFDREFQAMVRENREMVREDRERWVKLDLKSQETERIFQETDRVVQATSRKVEEVTVQIGNLGSRWGEFVEGLIAPSCIAMFTERGIPVDEVFSRAKKTVAGEHMEIDLLVSNAIAAVLVEVKSKLKVEDVRTHLKRLKKFKSFFPRYAACQVYGAVAGIVIDSDADLFAMNKGLFVIVQSGDQVRIANDKAFVPRIW